jgi:hypothetical protein
LWRGLSAVVAIGYYGEVGPASIIAAGSRSTRQPGIARHACPLLFSGDLGLYDVIATECEFKSFNGKRSYGNTLKEQYLASARDRIATFLLAAGEVRGAILNGTRMVNEMRANHELGILETLVLGRAYLGIALMAADLKGSDRVALLINCSGLIKGLSVEANAFGEVRATSNRSPSRSTTLWMISISPASSEPDSFR